MSPRSPRSATSASFSETRKSPVKSPSRIPFLDRQDSVDLAKNRMTKTHKPKVAKTYKVKLHHRNQNTKRMISENLSRPLHELGVHVSNASKNGRYQVLQTKNPHFYGGKNKTKKNKRGSRKHNKK